MTQRVLHAGREGSADVPEYVHGTELSETDGAVEWEHLLRN